MDRMRTQDTNSDTNTNSDLVVMVYGLLSITTVICKANGINFACV